MTEPAARGGPWSPRGGPRRPLEPRGASSPAVNDDAAEAERRHRLPDVDVGGASRAKHREKSQRENGSSAGYIYN